MTNQTLGLRSAEKIFFPSHEGFLIIPAEFFFNCVGRGVETSWSVNLLFQSVCGKATRKFYIHVQTSSFKREHSATAAILQMNHCVQ